MPTDAWNLMQCIFGSVFGVFRGRLDLKLGQPCASIAVQLCGGTTKGNEWQVKPVTTRTSLRQPRVLRCPLGTIYNTYRYSAIAQLKQIRQNVSVMKLLDSGYTIYRNQALINCSSYNKRRSTISRGQRMTHPFRGRACLCWFPGPFTSSWHRDSNLRQCGAHVQRAKKVGGVVVQSRLEEHFSSRQPRQDGPGHGCLLHVAQHSKTQQPGLRHDTLEVVVGEEDNNH